VVFSPNPNHGAKHLSANGGDPSLSGGSSSCIISQISTQDFEIPLSPVSCSKENILEIKIARAVLEIELNPQALMEKPLGSETKDLPHEKYLRLIQSMICLSDFAKAEKLAKNLLSASTGEAAAGYGFMLALSALNLKK
jgi:hypothetical protein